MPNRTNNLQLLFELLIIGVFIFSIGCKSKKTDVPSYVVASTSVPKMKALESTVSDSIEIKGCVLDSEKEPLVGVSVYTCIDNVRQLRTYTDINGNFVLKVHANDILVFTMISQPLYVPVWKLEKDKINIIVLGVK
jgi:hypothetical protein